MKKSFFRTSLLFAAAVMLVLSSCKSAPETGLEDKNMKKPAKERRDLPEFFLSPPAPEDQYVGLGMARLKDDNLSRTAALARARADIATQVSVVVESMLTDYAQESGADNDTQTLVFVERVSKEVANIELNGAITKEQYPANDGTWYTMVYFPKAAMLDEVQTVFNRNEDAAFAEFKAQQALDRLNAELENKPPKSAGVDSPVNKEEAE
ncbi:MAG: hypothetical protein B0D92_00775 [Spirochaeta sp. LUC14_002_19_P3]|nr:MAG: hypothetical protein B0D92_00775 [Spirochaeta sp. LUC14_002_19_P3]